MKNSDSIHPTSKASMHDRPGGRRSRAGYLFMAIALFAGAAACSASNGGDAELHDDVAPLDLEPGDAPAELDSTVDEPPVDEATDELGAEAADDEAGTTVEQVLGVAEMKLQTEQCTRSGERWSGGPENYDVPVSSADNTDCWMDRGDVSSAVRSLQRALAYCWWYAIDVDGEYGPQTQGALRDLQNLLGIATDGVYGPQTRNAMGSTFASTLADRCVY